MRPCWPWKPLLISGVFCKYPTMHKHKHTDAPCFTNVKCTYQTKLKSVSQLPRNWVFQTFLYEYKTFPSRTNLFINGRKQRFRYQRILVPFKHAFIAFTSQFCISFFQKKMHPFGGVFVNQTVSICKLWDICEPLNFVYTSTHAFMMASCVVK